MGGTVPLGPSAEDANCLVWDWQKKKKADADVVVDSVDPLCLGLEPWGRKKK